MPTARARVEVPGARIAEAEALWYDPGRWPAFIDGLAHVVRMEGDYPGVGARTAWDSFPGGRGRVLERVVAYEPRVGQQLEVRDPKIRGRQSVRFAPTDGERGGVRVELELEYELLERTPITVLTDALFIRRAQADSLRRTLLRFARELREELELGAS